MSDAVDAGSVSVETTSSAPDPSEIATSASHGAGIPQMPSSPASDPQPVETPVVTELPAEVPQPQETPVIETPEELPPAQDLASSPRSELGSSTGAPATPVAPLSIKDRAYAALEKLRFKKRAKLDKVVALASKKRSIKNDDVEKLLRVSDSTAQRYLNQLMKEGKLRRVGSPKQPTYEPF